MYFANLLCDLTIDAAGFLVQPHTHTASIEALKIRQQSFAYKDLDTYIITCF